MLGSIHLAIIILFLMIGCLKKNNKLLFILCGFAFELAWVIVYFILTTFFFSQGLWLTWVICVAIFLIIMFCIGKPFYPKTQKFIVFGLTAVIVISLCGVIIATVYYNSIPEASEIVSLRDYEPFRENTLAKSLDEPSSLCLEDNLPRIDGATALYPLYSAFVRATYPESEYNVRGYISLDGSTVVCSTTSDAFYNLLNGYADIIFLADISNKQRETAHERGIELKLTPIGKEAFVFFVNNRNSVSNLSIEEIQGIYSGKITNWQEVGGKNNSIRAYQRSKNSGSQTALQHIMGTVSLMTPPKEDTFDFMGGIYEVVADYKNYKNSIGFSFLYYITGMIAENKVKLLSINGIDPSAESIANGTYPFVGDFYAITVVQEPETDEDKMRVENTQKLIEWILSPQGQSLVEKTGYVPLFSY
ncbi:MAG: PstS family phosphate ABC transporter substrate-binding protein [Oscillospiraceae bacterium]|nr:PstS family phosphate ABC transporter substrate-binding protein [Oscillospiraceae bacterium]